MKFSLANILWNFYGFIRLTEHITFVTVDYIWKLSIYEQRLHVIDIVVL